MAFFSPQDVISTKRVEEGVVVRKRHCKECGHRFYTSQDAEQPISSFVASQLILKAKNSTSRIREAS